MDAEGFGDGGACDIRINDCGMVSLLLHGRSQQGSHKGFSHAALAADYGDYIFDAGHFVRGLKHAFRVPVLAGFPAGRTIVIAVFTHF